MLTRLLTALIGIPIALTLVFCPGGNLFGGAMWLLTVFAIMEVVAMFSKPGSERKFRPNPIAAGLGSLFALSAWLAKSPPFASWFSPALTFGFMAAVLWELIAAWKSEEKTSFHSLASGLLAGFYVGYLYSFAVLLRRVEGVTLLKPFGEVETGAAFVMLLLLTVWVGDSTAYFVGRAFGKHKLAPRLSPGKTIEGSIGNLIGCIIAAALTALWIRLSLLDGVCVGLIVGIFGQIGDLFESLIKREAGVKDSGAILPGHGGILDRFDALMFCAPLVYYYLKWTHKL